MTPAETPTACAACQKETPKDDEGNLVSRFWTGDGTGPFYLPQHVQDLHRSNSEKDARIRELQATVQSAIRIYRQVESERRPNGKGLSPFFFGQRLRRLIREWVELSEAALARSEGGGA